VSNERDQAGELVVEARVEAPQEVVFSFFTEPEKYRRWKGQEAELDPRQGGYLSSEDGRGERGSR